MKTNQLYFKMSKIRLFLLVFALSWSVSFAQNGGLDKGDALPNPEITINNIYGEKEKIRLYDYKKDLNLLVVLMPDISAANPSAKIISTGIDVYFAQGLSFSTFDKFRYGNPELKVLVITNNNPDVIAEYDEKYGLYCDIVGDENGLIANFFGINKWKSSSDASHVYAVGTDNKVVYARHDYKGEGEKLKDIQSNLYSLFNLTQPLATEYDYPALLPGEDARDFEFTYIGNMMTANYSYSAHGKLSDYFGSNNVLIAFYPAPYSYSCAMEVTRFNTYAEERLLEKMRTNGSDDIELLMISVSNSQILTKWKDDMALKNVKLVSDATGEISMKYNSFNALGWNRRTVFLINKEGKVQYIDWDYNVDNDEDFGVLKEQITAAK